MSTVLARFSLYGFLKNQRYFEPFLLLALLDKGLSFLAIGLLFAVREATVVVLELPSGALADARGRRFAMIVSFCAYLASFTTFGSFDSATAMAAAMTLLGVGDAFRTGTHKAMIFGWLRAQGREADRTRVYGYTRSWSKIGSAVSVVLGAAIVFWTGSYEVMFFATIPPYLIGIVNFLGYPAETEAEHRGATTIGVLRRAAAETFTRASLRRLVLESMGFMGVFHGLKDYLQPVLQAVAITSLAMVVGATELERTAIVVGAVYFVLYAMSATASRQAHRVPNLVGSEDSAARLLWICAAAIFAAMVAADLAAIPLALAATFVVLHVLQDVWRPILVGRFDAAADADRGATVLSIESQSRRLTTVLLAPLFGLLVDALAARGGPGLYWPLGAVGAAIAVVFALSSRTRGQTQEPSGSA